MQGEYLITDYGAKGDNAFDNAPVINNLIAKFGSSGGSIVIPVGDFRINSPIVISNKNCVTIRGVNYGQRSNVDPAPPGVFGPAGGSKIILGAGVQYGIWAPDSGPQVQGLTIKDVNISASDGAVYQIGVYVNHSNRWTRIADVSFVNLKKGIYLKQADDANIESCWIAECESPLHLDTGNNCIVANNSLGGQTGGITAEFDAHIGLVFTGNAIFPDGYTCVSLMQATNCNVSYNFFTSPYTGAILIDGSMNSFIGNNVTAVLVNGNWQTDPKARTASYGLIRISGNDNVMADTSILSWQPVNDTRVHCVSGSRNMFRDLYIGANDSFKKLFTEGQTTSTRVTHCGYSNEINLGGSATARVEYDP